MRAADTSDEAHAVQLELYRRMTPARRAAIAAAMSDDVRDITRAGIRDRHPEYTPEQIEWALRRLVHGDDLFRAAWPDAPIMKP